MAQEAMAAWCTLVAFLCATEFAWRGIEDKAATIPQVHYGAFIPRNEHWTTSPWQGLHLHQRLHLSTANAIGKDKSINATQIDHDVLTLGCVRHH